MLQRLDFRDRQGRLGHALVPQGGLQGEGPDERVVFVLCEQLNRRGIGGLERVPSRTRLLIFYFRWIVRRLRNDRWCLSFGRRDNLLFLQVRQSEKVLPNQVIMFGVLSRAAGNREVFELMCARPKAPCSRKCARPHRRQKQARRFLEIVPYGLR